MSLIAIFVLLAAELRVARRKIRAATNEVRYSSHAAKSIWLQAGLEEASFHSWNG